MTKATNDTSRSQETFLRLGICFSIFVIYPKYLINLKYVEEQFSEPLENLVRVAFGSSYFAMTCFINESLFEKNMLILLRKKNNFLYGIEDCQFTKKS